jgi:DNA-directed RNA polymerase specialized sigma24 family protein
MSKKSGAVDTFDDFPSLNDLLDAVAAGDVKAQQSLYKTFEPSFQRIVKHLLQRQGCRNPEEDGPGVGSDAWQKTFQYMEKLRNADSFASWANRIIRNEVNAHLRRCISRAQAEDKHTNQSRKDVQAALARLQKIAESLPPVDVVAIVREGRDASHNN